MIGAPMPPWFGARSPTCPRHTPPDRRQIILVWSPNRLPFPTCRRASRSSCSPPISAIRAWFGSRRTATSSSPNPSRANSGPARRRGSGQPQHQRSVRLRSRPAVRHSVLPAGSDPHWIYVANTGSVVRYPYRSGDLEAGGKAEVIVRDLPGAGGRSVQRGHITRDIAFSKNGRQMFISVDQHRMMGGDGQTRCCRDRTLGSAAWSGQRVGQRDRSRGRTRV